MADWRSILDQLEISDGAVAGLSAADKPIIAGKLLQIPAEDRALFFRGQHSDVLRRLRTLLPDVASVPLLTLRGLMQQPLAKMRQRLTDRASATKTRAVSPRTFSEVLPWYMVLLGTLGI